MASTVAVFPSIRFRKLIPWLLGQPRGMAPSRSRGSLGLRFTSLLCRMPAALLLARRRRSQLCRGASPSFHHIELLLLLSPSAGHCTALTHSAPVVT
ncbi:hypothetical protein OYC64_010690 [Pagothenia borchgrevinki]|uniref:Uncharacterized protein n=1 Tax=Pagothenia borchgrevinki TaxID=8213 RepID=A0ABD2GXC0_PAGBO